MTRKSFLKQRLQSIMLALFLWIGLITTPVVCSTVKEMVRGLTSLENLALSGTASQSTTHTTNVASKAIDGDTDHGFAHTKDYELNNWWMVDLNGIFNVKKISIWGRTDCCWNRLTNATVKVLDYNNNILGSFVIGVVTNQVLFEFNMNIDGASVVRIEQDPSLHSMALKEVQVFGIEYAPPDDSVTHISQGLKKTWKVDLKGIFHVKKITIFNHSDCCKTSINGAVVKVLDDGNTILGSYDITGATSQTKFEFDVSLPKVSFTNVELPNANGYLTLAKVKDISDQSMSLELNLHLYQI